MKDKLLAALGLCRKAGKLVSGFDATADCVKRHEALLVVTSQDLSPKSKKEILFITNKYSVEVTDIPVTIEEIGQRTGKRAGVLAVTDAGFKALIKAAINRVNGEE